MVFYDYSNNFIFKIEYMFILFTEYISRAGTFTWYNEGVSENFARVNRSMFQKSEHVAPHVSWTDYFRE